MYDIFRAVAPWGAMTYETTCTTTHDGGGVQDKQGVYEGQEGPSPTPVVLPGGECV